MTTDFFDTVQYDVWAQTYASKPFDATAHKAITSIPGVREAQSLLTNNARVAGTTAQLYGLSERPMYTPDLVAGNWYSDAQARTSARVVVIGEALAHTANVGVGDRIRFKDRGRTRRAQGRRDQQQRRRPRDGPPPARHAAVGPSQPQRDQQLVRNAATVPRFCPASARRRQPAVRRGVARRWLVGDDPAASAWATAASGW
jgi:hypothetical protein